MANDASFSEKQSRTLANIGTVVIAMQTTEKLIAMALSMALPEGQRVTIETLTRETEANAKSTLGKLILILKRRADLDPDFGETLTAFLRDRNDLVHDTGRIVGFDLRTASGLEVADAFLANLMANTEFLTKIFASLLLEWSEQVGLSIGVNDRVRRYLGDLDGIAYLAFRPRP